MDYETTKAFLAHLQGGGQVYGRILSPAGAMLSEGLLDRNGSVPPLPIGWPVQRAGTAAEIAIWFDKRWFRAPIGAPQVITDGNCAGLNPIAPETLREDVGMAPAKRSLDDRFDEWLVGLVRNVPDSARRVVLDPVFSRWDLYSAAVLVGAILGPNDWVSIPAGVVWLAGRLWAERSARGAIR